MREIALSFERGGFMMYPILLMGVLMPMLGVGLLTASLVTKRLAMGFAAVVLIGAAVPAVLGLTGYAMGVSAGEAAVRSANPEDQEVMRHAVEGEALTCTTWGYGFAIVPALLGFALLGLGLSRLPRFQPPSS
jgi:hypothetical protein